MKVFNFFITYHPVNTAAGSSDCRYWFPRFTLVLPYHHVCAMNENSKDVIDAVTECKSCHSMVMAGLNERAIYQVGKHVQFVFDFRWLIASVFIETIIHNMNQKNLSIVISRLLFFTIYEASKWIHDKTSFEQHVSICQMCFRMISLSFSILYNSYWSYLGHENKNCKETFYIFLKRSKKDYTT